MDDVRIEYLRTTIFKARKSSLWLKVMFIVLVTESDAWASSCPHHVTLVLDGHTAINNNVCYLFVNKEVYWDDAKDSCKSLGGEMLTIEDDGTMEFIKTTLDSSMLGWDRNGVWLGARQESGSWRWTNGKKVTYTNWADKQPQKFFGRTLSDCLQMRQEDGWKWHNSLCRMFKFHYNYICQFVAEERVDPAEKLSANQTQANMSSVIVAVIIINLFLLLAAVLLVLYLRHRHMKYKDTHTSALHVNNNTYSGPPVRTSQIVYDSPVVSNDQRSSNAALYMYPSEVISSTHSLHAGNILAKNCNYCSAYAGGNGSDCPSTTSELKLSISEFDVALMQGWANNEKVSPACECMHRCCAGSQGDYINSQMMMTEKHAKVKEVYSNVDI